MAEAEAKDTNGTSNGVAPEATSTKELTSPERLTATLPGVPLVRGRLADIGAILSGVLDFVAFAGFDIWPLTFVCLVPLYLSLIGQTPKRAAWLGLLTGLSMNIGGFYWLVNMLKTFSGFPLPRAFCSRSSFSAYQGGRLALLGWLHGRATARGWPAPIVFGAAFAASELAYPLLFPWYYAATVHNVPVLMQLADIGGPILVGLVLVTVNLAIAEPLRARLAASRGVSHPVNHERHSLAIDRRVVGAGVIALVFALLYGTVRIAMTNGRIEKAEQARVGYVQGNMSLMGKRENPGEGLRRHRQMTGELREKGVDLVGARPARRSRRERTSRRRVTSSVTASLQAWASRPFSARSSIASIRIASDGSTRPSAPTSTAISEDATTSSSSWPSANTCRSAIPSPSCTSGRPTADASRPAPRSSRSR